MQGQGIENGSSRRWSGRKTSRNTPIVLLLAAVTVLFVSVDAQFTTLDDLPHADGQSQWTGVAKLALDLKHAHTDLTGKEKEETALGDKIKSKQFQSDAIEQDLLTKQLAGMHKSQADVKSFISAHKTMHDLRVEMGDMTKHQVESKKEFKHGAHNLSVMGATLETGDEQDECLALIGKLPGMYIAVFELEEFYNTSKANVTSLTKQVHDAEAALKKAKKEEAKQPSATLVPTPSVTPKGKNTTKKGTGKAAAAVVPVTQKVPVDQTVPGVKGAASGSGSQAQPCNTQAVVVAPAPVQQQQQKPAARHRAHKPRRPRAPRREEEEEEEEEERRPKKHHKSSSSSSRHTKHWSLWGKSKGHKWKLKHPRKLKHAKKHTFRKKHKVHLRKAKKKKGVKKKKAKLRKKKRHAKGKHYSVARWGV